VDFYEICDLVSIILQRVRVHTYNSCTDSIPLSEVTSNSESTHHEHTHVHNKSLDNHILDGDATPLPDTTATPPQDSTTPHNDEVTLPLPEQTQTPTSLSATILLSPTPYSTSSPTPMYDGAGPGMANTVGVY